LVYCNAGHEPPYRHGALGLVRLPIAARPPVGVPEDYPFESESLELSPGEWLCALTDGVTEAMNPAGELYGAPRLEQVLCALPALASPSEINAAVLADVRRFVGEAPTSDDLTLFTLRLTSAR
jgi:adenylate cyclase